MLDFLVQPRNYPWLVVVLSALVIVPCLGSHGFWEPREIEVADSASQWLKQRADAVEATVEEDEEPPARAADEPAPASSPAPSEPGVASEPGPSAEPGAAEPPAAEPPRQLRTRQAPGKKAPPAKPREPRFTERLVAHGIDSFGFAEGSARAPLALFGLIAVLATYLVGVRIGGRRAGLIAALVMLSFPLLVLQSRQLTSEIASVTGSALLVLGLVGLALPRAGTGWMRGALIIFDVAAAALGALIALDSSGPLLGLVPPLGGVGLGALFWTLHERRGQEMRVLALAVVALVGCIAALAWFAHGTFTIVPAREGDLELFGRTLEASREALPGLGGVWKSQGDAQTPFSAVFEQIGFGVFPWVAIAPLAVARLGAGAAGPAGWARSALFAWAALGWLVASIVTRKVGPVTYPALAAIALAIGLWVDEILTARETEGGADGASHAAYPLLALFGFLAAMVVAKDFVSTPDELTSLTASGVKYPKGAHVHWAILPIAASFAAALAAGMFLWRGPYRMRWPWGEREILASAGRWGLHAAVAIGVVFALFMAHVWIPALGRRMSSRDVLEVYNQRRQPGDQLGLLGNLGSGPSYYAGADYVKLGGRSELATFLARPGRVFALTRASELCPLHKDSLKRGFQYHVLDNRNVQFLLLSNKLQAGEVDRNPLADALLRTPPDNIQKKLSANFDDQVELIGVNMPRRVGRGERFKMTLFYRVIKPVTRPWKIFVHLNAPNAPSNITGDHAPVPAAGCSMTYFQTGDYIVDTFEVRAGDSSFPKTDYQVFTGFFVGSSGNYTNMKALSGNPDDKDRVPVGTIQVR